MAAKRKPARPAKSRGAAKRKPRSKDRDFDTRPESNRRGFDAKGNRKPPPAPKKPKKARAATPTGSGSGTGKIEVPARDADYSIKATACEFHELEPGERQTGLRFVFKAIDPKLRVCDDGRLVKRPLYGVARIEYAPTPDHVTALVMQGKFVRAITYPTKAGEAAEIRLNFSPAPPIDGVLADKILKLKRAQQEIYLEFWGSYTKELQFEADDDEEENLDDPDVETPEDGSEATEPENAAATTLTRVEDPSDESETGEPAGA